MGLPSRWQGSQKVLLLAGFILSCVLQLVSAQSKFSVAVEPPNPKAGQTVRLSPRGGPSPFVQCQWLRDTRSGRSGTIFTYSPQSQEAPKQGSGHSGREALQGDCSLSIEKLTPSDSGNYTVVIEAPSKTQQADQQQETKGETIRFSVNLQVSDLDIIPISVDPNPQRPNLGQNVTLILQGAPRQINLCKWTIKVRSSNREKVLQYSPGERGQQSTAHERQTIQKDCSLHIMRLTASDIGNYTVQIYSPVDQQQQPEQGTASPIREKFYQGQVYLDFIQQSVKEPQVHGGLGSLSYSAGVIAGALLGSLAWADALTSLFSLLFCSFTSLRQKLLP